MMRRSFEDNQDGGHVVTADSGHGIGGDKPLEKVMDNLRGLVLFEFRFYGIYDALVVVNVVLPNPIAAQ